MQRFLFSRTENWIVLLLLTAGLAGTMLFGGVVRYVADGGTRLGAIGNTAFEVAMFPWKVKDVFQDLFLESRFYAEEQRFGSQSGFVPARHDAAVQDAGYLLLARHDGDKNAPVVELVDLDQHEVLHAWRVETDTIAPLLTRDHEGEMLDAFQPYVLPNGHVLGVTGSEALVMLDGCSNVQWVLDRPRFHHSIERDTDGYFWVPYRVDPPQVPGSAPDTMEDGLARISPSGDIVSLIPLSPALIAGGYGHLLYAMEHYIGDPMHMNDIQPVLEDGPWWRRGDLFVSLRSRSVVLLYRPSTDAIVWLKAGPWMHQHDVNILSEHEISVFSNNAARLGHNRRSEVLGANDVYIYDFDSGEVSSPWRNALRQHEVRTTLEGRATVIENGDVFVEETEQGRTLQVAADGAVRWVYVNRGADGQVYTLNWSRYLDATIGSELARAVVSLDCHP